MFKTIETISKFLEIESQGQYKNRVIIGGFEKYLPNAVPLMQSENVPPVLINAIKDTFSGYGLLGFEEREQAVIHLSQLIEKETTIKIRLAQPVEKTPEQETVMPRATTPSPARSSNAKPSGDVAASPAPTYSNRFLQADITTLEKIGPTKKSQFAQLGVQTIGDLLYLFPRRYDDYSKLKPINRLEYGDELTVIATVQSVLSTKMRNREQSRVEVVVSDGTGFLRLVFFRGTKFLRSFEAQFPHGRQLVISGKVTMYLGRLQMDNPSFEDLEQAHLNTNGIIPVYPLTAGLSQKLVRNTTSQAINYCVNRIGDYLPESIKQNTGLIDLPVALHQVHYPQSLDLLQKAQSRLAFDEIFLLQLGVLQQKRNWVSQPANKYPITPEMQEGFIASLPYELTGAQKKVIAQIAKDLASGAPMNRLLQGDVGSGKTVVAALAALAVIHAGAQVAFMAPTSILAEQHFRSLGNLLANIGDATLALQPGEIMLLTGETSAKEREEIKTQLLSGKIKLLIGTHALIEDPIQFQNLQLVIIDEQHRFGVTQRAALRQKGQNPHLLVMSATPIPRSLALTLYGDLELSIMDEMPAGRKPVQTHILSPLERERAYQIIRTHIKQGHQAFIVYPLIESDEEGETKAAVDDHDMLQEEIFPDLKIGLLHGRMPAEEKERVMSAFLNREFPILVSTTVIEVGVDIPNATVMMIEGANRFGLAQLHQLRGRVGRNQEQSICLLIPESEDATENERLKAMVESNDGFVLAEKDLQQRGPGDFIGYRQSGFADLKMAKITDVRLIEKARETAEKLFAEDPQLEKPENAIILQRLTAFWQSDKSDIS
jgi:ATP-dependent DNA helicase RecG